LLAIRPPTCTAESFSDLAFDVDTICTILGCLKDWTGFLAREKVTVWLFFKAVLCTMFT
jgi:hypothetical protein